MGLITWNKEFEVGIDEVDRDHRELAGLINELHDTIRDSGDIDHVLAALGEIHTQVAAHFALEEGIMVRIAYPGYAGHKEDHETLLEELRDIIAVAEDEGTYDESRLADDLERWFTRHFKTHDASLHDNR